MPTVIQAVLSPDLASAVRERAEREDRSISSVVRAALRREFESNTNEAALAGGSVTTPSVAALDHEE